MGSELICGICDSVHDAKLVYDHRWMSIEMAQQLRKKFEQPQGEATPRITVSHGAPPAATPAPGYSLAQTEGGEKPREIFVGPPDRLETALDIMGIDPLSQGTFTCDICGKDVPHSHEPAEVETERYIRPAFKKTTVPRQAWAQLEAHGPYLEPLTDQLFKHFASGWVAAKRHYQIVETSSPPATAAEKCGQPAASFIPRWGMSFACVLPKGHYGDHKQGGNCFRHGEYVGAHCPNWPDCSPAPPATANKLWQKESEEVEQRHIGRIAKLQAEVAQLRQERDALERKGQFLVDEGAK